MAEPTNYKVYLELQRRNDVGTDAKVNRIALNALSISDNYQQDDTKRPCPTSRCSDRGISEPSV